MGEGAFQRKHTPLLVVLLLLHQRNDNILLMITKRVRQQEIIIPFLCVWNHPLGRFDIPPPNC